MHAFCNYFNCQYVSENVDSNVRQITRIILQNFHLKSGLYAILCTLTEFKYNIISFEEFYSWMYKRNDKF